MTSGLLPAVPQLSALASRFTLHQFAVQHLLCPLLVFRVFLPVTDSDKLTKAHETKKTRTAAVCLPLPLKLACEPVRLQLAVLVLAAACRCRPSGCRRRAERLAACHPSCALLTHAVAPMRVLLRVPTRLLLFAWLSVFYLARVAFWGRPT